MDSIGEFTVSEEKSEDFWTMLCAAKGNRKRPQGQPQTLKQAIKQTKKKIQKKPPKQTAKPSKPRNAS